MDRSLVGRLGIGGLIRQPAAASRGKARRRAPVRSQRGFDRGLALLAALLSAALRLLGDARAFVWRRRRLRLLLLALLVATPLLGGGWVWLRSSSLTSIERVRVSGAHGSDAAAIDGALSTAAHRMGTLDVNTATLLAAVSAYPEVRDVKVRTSFPHGLSIRVIEQPAVAAVSAAGTRFAVAADGVVLGSGQLSSSLPALAGTTGLSTGQHVRDGAMLDALAVLGAAPAPLAKLIQRVFSGPQGLTLGLRGGLLAYFGDATRPHAKWQSLATVLADKSSAGATYVDVRLPERPAAGFPAGLAPAAGATGAGGEAGSSTTATSSESTQSIAEHLSAAAGSSAPTGTQPGPSSKTEAEAEPPASATTHAEAPASTSEEASTSTSEAAK